MKISPKSDYAIRALLDLCHHFQDCRPVPATVIADRQQIPLKYLEQIMLILKKAGIVHSKRGIGGGFILHRQPEQIILGDIIRTIEGDIHPTAGLTIENKNTEQQALEEVWVKVTDSITEIIDSVSFADIMSRADELAQNNNDIIDFVI